MNVTPSTRNPFKEAHRWFTDFLNPQFSSAARERRDVLVLLFVVALVTAPHLTTIPIWAISILLMLWGWRFWLTLARRPTPSAKWTWPLLLASGVAVYREYGTWFGASAGVLLLLLLMGLKLIEMRARRDIFVVIFLCFFILLTLFLHDQSLATGLLTLLSVLLLFFVLTSVNLTQTDLPAKTKIRLVSVVLLKSLPLAVVFFLLFPRLSGPLWGTETAQSTGETGLSNSMSPGALGRLLDSDAIAFRARFETYPPLNHAQYWRGPTFDFFNGRTWSALVGPHTNKAPTLKVNPDSAFDYEVTLEPHARDWIFALDMPQSIQTVDGLAVHANAQNQLIADRLITQRVRYKVRSYTRYTLGPDEHPLSLRHWLQLPQGFNPRTLQLAGDMRGQVPNATTSQGHVKLVANTLDMFRHQNFRYTLTPSALGRNSVDDFLFETREGYCEHYSSAFVTLMRAMGIPARVVTGYLGGELNPVDGFFSVRQSDAHAWAEVWLGPEGWVRVDPTAAVAPERVEQGASIHNRHARQTTERSNSAAINWLRQAVFKVRFNWEALQNAWNQWVLSYTTEQQMNLLSRLGFEPNWRALGQLLSFSLALILALLAWFSLRQRVVRDPLGEVYTRLRQRLSAAGIAAPPSCGPRTLASRLDALDARSQVLGKHLLYELERLRYTHESVHVRPKDIRILARTVKRFKPQPRPS